MKRPVIFTLFMMICITLPAVPAFAAELLDVKPVYAESGLIVEILADIPMTYTCHNLPEQVRTVVDITDVDPEKIEPLIVVNKGAVSSISVDKAQISGVVASRLIFNLNSDVDISVTASADRKKLTVTFGSGKPASGDPEKPAVAPAESAPAPQASLVPAPAAAVPAKSEPAAKEVDTPAAPAVLPNIDPASTVSVKLQPVVPGTFRPRKRLTITAIKVETSQIDIKAGGRLDDFTQFKLTEPNRLVIDVSGAANSLSKKSFPVRRFGLVQVRAGSYPDHTRIVLDAGNLPFPEYEIKSTDTGLRINFK